VNLIEKISIKYPPIIGAIILLKFWIIKNILIVTILLFLSFISVNITGIKGPIIEITKCPIKNEIYARKIIGLLIAMVNIEMQISIKFKFVISIFIIHGKIKPIVKKIVVIRNIKKPIKIRDGSLIPFFFSEFIKYPAKMVPKNSAPEVKVNDIPAVGIDNPCTSIKYF
jgi:hypothetical protein